MADVDKARLIRLMVGRESRPCFLRSKSSAARRCLEARGLSCRASGVRNVSLKVRAGEILGLAGLGRRGPHRVGARAVRADAGRLRTNSARAAARSPSFARAGGELGIAYVPEDRRRHGVVLEMPVAANVTLAILRRIATAGWIRFGRERIGGKRFTQQLGIKTP